MVKEKIQLKDSHLIRIYNVSCLLIFLLFPALWSSLQDDTEVIHENQAAVTRVVAVQQH